MRLLGGASKLSKLYACLLFHFWVKEFAMTQAQTQRPPLYADRTRKHAVLSHFSQAEGRVLYSPAYRRKGQWNYYSDGKGGIVSFAFSSGARFFFEQRHITDY